VIIVSGKVKAKPGALNQVRGAMETVINATRQEEGCIDYSYGVDILDTDTILVLEYWESWEVLKEHFTQPHMAVWVAALGDAGIVSRDIKFIEAGEEKDLFA
jgi:quinol monooxygenase YgiN